VAKSETSFLVGELVRRQAQVQKDSVNFSARLSRFGQNVTEFGVTGLVKTATGMVENQPSFFEHRAVTIQAQKTAVRSELAKDPRGMATPTNSSVDNSLPRFDVQPLQHFCHKHRNMTGKRRSLIT